MSEIKVGDKIEHVDIPGFRMPVLDVEPCEDEEHNQYKIVDPEGAEDWICGHDVRKVG